LPLGEWVLNEACRQQVAWVNNGMGVFKIAVNMSSRQFRQDDLAERVANIIQRSGVDPHAVTLELTESMVMQDVSSTLMTLRSLKIWAYRFHSMISAQAIPVCLICGVSRLMS